MGFLSGEKSLEDLEMEKQRRQAILEVEERKALIAEAKKRYGKDWTKFFSGMGSGIDWQALKFRLK